MSNREIIQRFAIQYELQHLNESQVLEIIRNPGLAKQVMKRKLEIDGERLAEKYKFSVQ